MGMKEHIELLTLALYSEDVNERMTAITGSGQLKSPKVLKLLLDAAKNETDINAKIALVKSIGNQGKSIKLVKETLLWYSRDSDTRVRRASIEVASVLDRKILTSVLLERLGDFNPEIKLFSIEMAGRMKLIKCSDKLISILNEATDNATIIGAAKALGNIQAHEAAEILFEKFRTGPNEVRVALSEILTSFGKSPKDDFLRFLSETTDPQLLQLSIGALQTIGEEDVVESISKFLRHTDPIVQNAAGNAMIKLDGTVPYIIKEFLIEPGNQKIHEILSIKGSKAVENLLSLKNHDEKSVTDNVDIILKRLMDRSQNLLSSGSPQQKIDATKVYLILYDEEYPILNKDAIKLQIETNISFQKVEVQKISLKTISKLGDSSSTDAVESILKISNDDDVIKYALFALGDFKDIKPIGTILDKSHSTKMEIRRVAYLVLGRIWLENPSLIDDTLARMLYDPSPEIKLDSIRIAKKLKSPISIQPLKELADARDPEINEKASSALEDLQKHFIENLSADSSMESLIVAIKSLINIGISNERVIESLFNLIEIHPDIHIRSDSFHALGNLGNEEILERLDEIDAIHSEVRAAKDWAVDRIKNLTIKSEDSLEVLRRGDIPDKPVDILKILNEQDHSIFGDYSEGIDRQLNEAISNFEGEHWGESINRINNVCENIVKAIIVDKKDELNIPDVDALFKRDHRTRINILGSRASFIERQEVFSTALLQIHQYRIESDAQHAGGEITKPSNAVLAIHALREVYLIAEEIFSGNVISE